MPKGVHITKGTLSDFFEKKYSGEYPNNPPREIQLVKPNLPKKKKIDSDILDILKEATIENNILFLESGALDRKTYVTVNKVLESLGGVWNRNKKGHVFDDDPQEIIDQVLHQGYYEKQGDFGYYPTPGHIVDKILEYAEIESNHSVLEPSAGQGHILDQLDDLDVTCGELLEVNRAVLTKKGYNLSFTNFLEYKEKTFDRIVMNPPFAGQADIDHVNHAYSLLKPGGRLVSIMSNGVIFRSTKKTVAFRELVQEQGWLEELPLGSFHTSGTEVRTIILVLTKESN